MLMGGGDKNEKSLSEHHDYLKRLKKDRAAERITNEKYTEEQVKTVDAIATLLRKENGTVDSQASSPILEILDQIRALEREHSLRNVTDLEYNKRQAQLAQQKLELRERMSSILDEEKKK